MADTEVGSFEIAQDRCPECGEQDNIQDVPGDDDLFVTCRECGYQWHEPQED